MTNFGWGFMCGLTFGFICGSYVIALIVTRAAKNVRNAMLAANPPPNVPADSAQG